MTRSPSRRVDDHEVVRRDRPQAHRVGRIRLAGPVPLPVAVLEWTKPSSASTGRISCTFFVPEALVGAERQLERRALHVVEQDVQVVGIDRARARATRRRSTTGCGRRTGRSARCCATSTAADRPLRRPARPARCQVEAIVPGIAGHHRDVERADVDAELERVGRRRPRAPALRAARARSRAGAAAGSRRGSRGSRPAAPGGPSKASFRYVVRISVDRRLCAKTISCSCCFRNSSATRRVSARYERRMPSSALTTGGLTKRKNFSPRGAPLSSTSSNGFPVSRFGQLARVGDRRRRADEDRVRSVVPADALQPAQDVRRGGCRTRRDTRAARR